jgi:hypothetical protein
MLVALAYCNGHNLHIRLGTISESISKLEGELFLIDEVRPLAL